MKFRKLQKKNEKRRITLHISSVIDVGTCTFPKLAVVRTPGV